MKKILSLITIIISSLFLFGFTNASDEPEVPTIEKTNFESLPRIALDKQVEVKIEQENLRYKLTFDFNTEVWVVRVLDLPHKSLEEWKNEDRLPRRMLYYMNEHNERILWYDFQNEVEATGEIKDDFLADIEASGGVKGFRPFVNWNIDTGIVNGTQKLQLFGRTRYVGDSFYVDVAFPMELDDLLQITLNYDFRHQFLWGAIYSPWNNATVHRFKDTTEPRYQWWEYLLKTNLVQGWDMVQNGFTADHIKNISSGYSSALDQNKYISDINNYLKDKGIDKTIKTSDIFDGDFSMYQVYLDSHYAFGSTGVDVKDIAIVEVLYEYKGEYFYVDYQDIEQIITEHIGVSFLENLPWLIVLVLSVAIGVWGIVGIVMLFKKKPSTFIIWLFVAGVYFVILVATGFIGG